MELKKTEDANTVKVDEAKKVAPATAPATAPAAKADAPKADAPKEEKKHKEKKEKKEKEVRKLIWDGKEVEPGEQAFKWTKGGAKADNKRAVNGSWLKDGVVDKTFTYKGYAVTVLKAGHATAVKLQRDDKVLLDNVSLANAIDYLQEKLNTGAEIVTNWAAIDTAIKFKRGLKTTIKALDENDNAKRVGPEKTEKQLAAEAAKAEKLAAREKARELKAQTKDEKAPEAAAAKA